MKRNKQAAIFAFLVVFVIPLILFFYWFNKERPTIETLPVMGKYEVIKFTDTLGNTFYDTTYRSISEFQLISHMGDTIDRSALHNKIIVAGFFFAGCDRGCQIVAKNLNYIQDVFADQDTMLILSHTVDPIHDSVPVLYEYARRFQVNNRKWLLLTGEREELYRLATEDYLIQEQKDEAYRSNFNEHYAIHETGNGINMDKEQYLDCEKLILLDKEGFTRGHYNGTDSLDIERLRIDIARLFLISDFPHTRTSSLKE